MGLPRDPDLLDLKPAARRIFHEALAAIDVREAVSRNLEIRDDVLRAAGTAFNLPQFRKIFIIALGKAATPMYEAAVESFSRLRPAPPRIEAVVVSPHRPSSDRDGVRYFPGSHPTPDESSRRAAVAVLELLHAADAQTFILFLISGGASSMLELPLDTRISTKDIAAFNRALVGSGLAITDINVLRKHLSAVKGGRLAAAAGPAAQLSLIISDVPAASLDMVGSGPSLPDPSSREHCLALFHELRSRTYLPPSVLDFFEQPSCPDTPKATDAAFRRAAWTSILSSEHLAHAAAKAAKQAGFHVHIDHGCEEGSCTDAARYLLERSRLLERPGERNCLISVGEANVTLGAEHGEGGRSQHFALQCAVELQGSARSTCVLSAGSDGVDGNSPAAGSVADAGTCARARALGIDPLATLAAFDSFRLFHTLGDTIITGPTGNNLRDLRLLLS